jgi:uncharacterized membrane protein
LSLPPGTTDAGVAHALDKAIPSIFAYALSFAVIAIYWLAHHRMFRYIRRLDATLLVLNLASLSSDQAAADLKCSAIASAAGSIRRGSS